MSLCLNEMIVLEFIRNKCFKAFIEVFV